MRAPLTLTFSLAAVVAATSLGVPSSTVAATEPVASAALSKNMTRARLVRQCVNSERARHGLGPLEYDADLAKAARMQARWMARNSTVGHDDSSGRGPDDRVRIFTDTFGGIGENALGGRLTASRACRAWFDSPGHHATMLDPEWTHIGTGVAAGGSYALSWVQVFGTKSAPESTEPAGPSEDEEMLP